MSGRKLLIDAAKSSKAGEPAFLAKPAGAPVYHGFTVIEESETDGWRIGAIMEFVDQENGDAFVIAPDGSRVGLVWQVGDGELETIIKADKNRWGVYAVWFPAQIKSTNDFAMNFRHILPALRRKFEEIKSGV